PSDIVSRVMSFGAPTPIEVAVSGPNLANNRSFAQKVQNELGKISSLRDLQFEQELEYPAVKVDIDRQLAGMMGVTADQIGRSLQHAAHADAGGQHPRRGSGTRSRSHRWRSQERRCASTGSKRRRSWSSGSDAGNVQRARSGIAHRRGRDFPFAGREFSILPP